MDRRLLGLANGATRCNYVCRHKLCACSLFLFGHTSCWKDCLLCAMALLHDMLSSFARRVAQHGGTAVLIALSHSPVLVPNSPSNFSLFLSPQGPSPGDYPIAPEISPKDEDCHCHGNGHRSIIADCQWGSYAARGVNRNLPMSSKGYAGRARDSARTSRVPRIFGKSSQGDTKAAGDFEPSSPSLMPSRAQGLLGSARWLVCSPALSLPWLPLR
ncbi:hypothetical protein DFH27DRAFT_78400 [Peziza echinospora]|nr:hypothetical protein DFH27DRAFT_78400 [Peziza echinospora]